MTHPAHPRQLAPTLDEMFAGVVSAPSCSSVSPAFDQSNRLVSERLAEWLEGLGFRVELQPVSGRDGKWNVVATIGAGEGGLVLGGHSDTVPCDVALWQSDPFTLSRRDGRLYGLGLCDMKGFFPLAIEAYRRLHGTPLRHPLSIVATADEESSMEGALELVRQGTLRGACAVIGEPTNLRPVRAHKGILMEAIRLTGHSGHSSDPSLGRSALEGMAAVLDELIRWRGELQAAHRDESFAVPVPTLNLGHIHGGDNPNRICGHCELHIDLRPLPGMGLDALRTTLAERLVARLAGSGIKLEIERLFCGTPPLATASDADLVRFTSQLCGHPAEAVAFCTEGPYYQQLGMETVVLGPGDIAQAHQPDEYLAESRIEPTISLLGELIRRYCIE
jgi:acetylornithine deacetylase